MRILNIQGDRQVAHLMDWILSGEGFEVINVREADGAVDHNYPDVIIINTNMTLPEKRACIDALRRLAPSAGIIDLSFGAETPPYDTGANGYLQKPFSADDLIARVRTVGGERKGLF